MFDDLHDPDAPRAGIDSLASVSRRAQQLRRRRSWALASASAVVIALVGVSLVVISRQGDDRVTLTVDDTAPPATTMATTVTATAPSTTVTAPSATPSTTEAAVIVETTSTVAASTTSVDATTTTSLLATSGGAFVAIDGSGDAVFVAADGTTRVLAEGSDPDDPAPVEGELTAIDSVTLSPDGTTAIVGTCCEPIPGTLSTVDLATGTEGFAGYGHLPAFTAFGDVVWETLGRVSAGDEPGTEAALLIEIGPAEGTIVDLGVVSLSGLDYALMLVAGPTGTTLWKLPAAGGDLQPSTLISDATWDDDIALSLAGVSAGMIWVLDRASGGFMVFDPETLSGIPLDQAPNDWLSAWFEDGVERYVDGQRRLFVDGVQVPGEYLWVR